jgi:hypothetical protein
MWQAFHSLINQANIGQSRSSVLNPIQWLLVILLAGTCLSLFLHSPLWLLTILAGGIVLALLLFLGAYIFFVRTNSDALRSESYSLTKLAIQNRLLGDSVTGIRDVPTSAPPDSALATSEKAQQQQ